MAKRISGTEFMLQEARDRVAKAYVRVGVAETDLMVAKAAWVAHQEAYDSMVKGLVRVSAPKSQSAPAAARKSKQKSSTDSSVVSSGTEKETATSTGVCECGEGRDYYIHSPDNPKGHEFNAAKTKVASA